MVRLASTSQLTLEHCPLCSAKPEVDALVSSLRGQGHGYKRVYRELKSQDFPVSRDQVQQHCAHVERSVMSSISDAEDRGQEVGPDYFSQRGIELPPEGVVWIAGTVEETGPNGERHWIRIKPELPEGADERVEIRQAQPVEVQGARPSLTVHSPGNWQTWISSPDVQMGYWRDHLGGWHTIHDEAALALVHEVAGTLDDLHGWIDCGDLMDLAAFSRWDPTHIDLQVDGLNKSFQRVSEEFARRRWLVGEKGEVVVLAGNHDIRTTKALQKNMPYLVGLKRPGDPEDEWPLMSVPYLTRARDYGVEWVSSFPSIYRKLNSNLCVTHSPMYGSAALATATKLAARMRMSVIFGHVHRSEQLSSSIETDKGARTLEIFSDGCLARTDGSLPSGKNSYDEYGNRILVGTLPEKTGMLSEAMDQGFSVLHVEIGGRERFSAERVRIWDGFCQFRGDTFEATIDRDGNPLEKAA